MVEPTHLAETPEDTSSDVEETERTGFLPIETNWFDRCFISVIIGVAVELFWMRFLEQSIPLWVAHVIILGLAVVIVRKG